MFVLAPGSCHLSGRTIESVISGSSLIANSVLVMQPHIEPDRTVEGTELIQTEPAQVRVEHLCTIGVRKVTIPQSPVCDRIGDAVNQLPNRGLSAIPGGIAPLLDVTVKVFRDCNLSGQGTPTGGNFHIVLMEDRFPALICNLDRTLLPLHLREGIPAGGAENPFDLHPGRRGGGLARTFGSLSRGWLLEDLVDHDGYQYSGVYF